jgi:hypothetical protein
MTTIEEISAHIRTSDASELSIENQTLTELELIALSNAVRGRGGLKVLKLEKCAFAAQGLAVLLKRISLDKTLKQLSLSGCNLKTNDYDALLHFIKQATFLSALDLSGLLIDDQAGVLLSQALSSNNSIQSLNLECNALARDSACAFKAWLPKATHLQDLNLSSNLIAEDEILALIETLTQNRTIRTLNLSFNTHQPQNPTDKSKFEQKIVALINEKIERNLVKSFLEHLPLQMVSDAELAFWQTKVRKGGKQCRSFKVPHTIYNLMATSNQAGAICERGASNQTLRSLLDKPSGSWSSFFGQSKKYRAPLLQKLRDGEFDEHENHPRQYNVL